MGKGKIQKAPRLTIILRRNKNENVFKGRNPKNE